ncbi:hypothetical protein A2526_03045 [candidate division WOR-1 bacterium RIFOXYD2_FULL_36_8]|uniref:Uncharacterized protein n=1 Tax=candidate division WOR-1 bacterium RIFOXYB2_FULL_36_35 TaxID=1802578 RepID=A0A1F4S5R4_UNCSA|nr:MAG: hypothetical protein A2230_05085 [candidate division WOR-1 bacterium RIFOXYA2_FULL_36_21]OGC15778.1 MAG: hypothetical protein A2290_05510 [candidate division WOR-1 bacterium RIFOXYB2_FULL_36_35]OGC18975.1 MAG: hypothetical protein A2282_09280 [candidate division WOR-1 bacterium RIFOXYA12_FULL_36_13]OGC39302.1 MAG: hypothetical protein A2526_03045 [candidate division WOR-1 bacterium RIFOXYD2_FULL_36_8]
MIFLSSINWITVFVTIAVVFIAYNTFQIIRYTIIKKKSEEAMKILDAKITDINKELEDAKKALKDKIENLKK